MLKLHKNLFTHKAKNNSLNLLGGSFKFNKEKQLESVLEKAPNRFLRFFCKIATTDKRIKKKNAYPNTILSTHTNSHA
jgi:hypothetical protein